MQHTLPTNRFFTYTRTFMRFSIYGCGLFVSYFCIRGVYAMRRGEDYTMNFPLVLHLHKDEERRSQCPKCSEKKKGPSRIITYYKVSDTEEYADEISKGTQNTYTRFLEFIYPDMVFRYKKETHE